MGFPGQRHVGEEARMVDTQAVREHLVERLLQHLVGIAALLGRRLPEQSLHLGAAGCSGHGCVGQPGVALGQRIHDAITEAAKLLGIERQRLRLGRHRGIVARCPLTNLNPTSYSSSSRS